MAKFSFDDIFRENPDGSLTPLRQIQIGGVTLGSGVTFAKGTYFGGVDFTLFRGHAIEADVVGDILIIRGIHQ